MKFTFESDDLDILQGIVEESTEHLNGIEEGILRLEMDFDLELVDRVFRAMHSVKGVASFLDFVPIKDTAHTLESFLTDIKKGVYAASSDITDILLRGVDILNLQVRQLQAHIQELENNPPRGSFDLEINDLGFREFVEEAEGLRANAVQFSEAPPDAVNGDSPATSIVSGGEHQAYPQGATLLESDSEHQAYPQGETPESAKTVVKLEMSSFRDQMILDFIEETFEHLDTIEQKCVELEKHNGDPEILNAILRGFHSIKGGAGVISSMQEQDNPDDPILAIKDLTHGTETLLQNYRNQSQQPSSEAIDLILAAVDKVAVLTKLVTEPVPGDYSIQNLMNKIESLFVSKKEEQQNNVVESQAVENMPGQLAAFVNISSQALDSMSGLLSTVKLNYPINAKRLKQYIRALKSLTSTARYLDYHEVEQFVDEFLTRLNRYVPEQDVLSSDLLDYMKNAYEKIKELLESKINTIREMLVEVPAEYGEKRLGEILVAERKVSAQQMDWALGQQKKLGEILVDSGMVKSKDIEIAVAKQSIARNKETAMVEQVRASSEIGGQSIRVSQDKLDRLMNMIGELIISKNRIFHLSSKIGMEYEMPALSREVKGVAGELARISDELQDAIMSVRMVPLKVLFQRYPRTIRDTSKKAGKMVEFIIEGDDTELDKTVIEAINDPLVHMLRNAVDHAIEPPEQRRAYGKPETGKVRLKAYYQGNYVAIEISDDGKGLNPEELKLKALKKGLIKAEQIESMSNEDAYHLIFAPGFSTKDVVSELSGRGVGMDVVRNNIESVGGSVSMSSAINVGTTFTLKIPLSMSIIRGLMVESADQRFIVPLDSIEETVKLPRDRIRIYQNSMMADIREEILPLMDLRDILKIGDKFANKSSEQRFATLVVSDSEHQACPKGASDLIAVVVIKVEGIKFGLIIDRFQKEQEFVVKALTEELASLKIYTGATILGDGSVVLILNTAQFLQVDTTGENGR
ncbi:MAG: chemotaxis protein CheA [Syntrophomonas sp.]|nr:chemotaxis protein CheA [Syntrophomonas sp.]